MSDDQPGISLLRRREIEAGVLGPVIRAFAQEIGDERALEVVRKVVAELARQGGADLAQVIGQASLTAFASTLDRWREGGALEIDMLEQSESTLSFNVTRCRYAEMYRALGMEELGSSLSCSRDLHLARGFNPEIELVRTQTIMEGAPFCDFRFRKPDQAREPESRPGPNRE